MLAVRGAATVAANQELVAVLVGGDQKVKRSAQFSLAGLQSRIPFQEECETFFCFHAELDAGDRRKV